MFEAGRLPELGGDLCWRRRLIRRTIFLGWIGDHRQASETSGEFQRTMVKTEYYE